MVQNQPNTESTGFYRARVEVLIGNRRISDFMAAAGLGLTGVGTKEIITITYAAGEVVDEARVSLAMDKMIAESNKARTDFKIVSYKVISIEHCT